MKQARVVTTAFSICIALSFLTGIVILSNVKAIPKYTRMIDSGKEIVAAVLDMQLQEKNYLLYHQEAALDRVKDEIDKLVSIHKSGILRYQRHCPEVWDQCNTRLWKLI